MPLILWQVSLEIPKIEEDLVVIVDCKPNMSQQCNLVAKKVIVGYVNR